MSSNTVAPLPATTPRQRIPFSLIDWLSIGAILAFYFLLYYRHLGSLGLYEDDFGNIANGVNYSTSQVFQNLRAWMTDWPAARPLGNGFTLLLSHVFFNVFGFHGLYLIPFSIISLNAILIYAIALQHFDRYTAFVAAGVFALLPTDTLRLSLHAISELQLAITMSLLGTLAWYGRHPWLTYLCLAIGMMCHESATLVYFGIPLLRYLPWPAEWRRYGKHWLLCIASIAGMMAIRAFVVIDARTRSAIQSPLWIAQRAVYGVWGGIRTHLYLLYCRLYQPYMLQSWMWQVIILAIAGLFFVAFLYWRQWRGADSLSRAAIIHLALFAVFAFAVPYIVYFTDPYWPSTHVAGRIASVHSVSGVGVSFGLAAIASAIWLIPRRIVVVALTGVLCLYLGLMLSFGELVAEQYADAWRNERQFWQTLLPQIRDAGDRTLIFVERKKRFDFPFTWVILSNSWADSIMLRKNFVIPPMQRDPRVFEVWPGWREKVKREGNELMWAMPAGEWAPARVPLEPGNVILVEPRNQLPVRSSESVLHLPAGDLPLKSPGPDVLSGWPKQKLYPYVFGNK